MWKTLSSETVFRHPRMTLVEDQVLLPSGIHTSYLRIKHTCNAVTLVCRRDDGQILLQKEYAYPIRQTLLQFPGGLVPLTEDLKIGANRELMEESDYCAGKLELLGTYFYDHRRTKAIMYVYLATALQPKSLPGDPEEDIETFWVSEVELEQMIFDGQIANCHLLTPWYMYKLYRHKSQI